MIEKILQFLFSGGVIYGSMLWLLRLGTPEDRTALYKDKNRTLWLAGLSLGNAGIVLVLCRMEQNLPEQNSLLLLYAEGFLLSLLAGGLLAAACMDARDCYVYNYVWWWCLLWIAVLAWLPMGGIGLENGNWPGGAWAIGRIQPSQMAAVLAFTALQQIVFARMYGRADSHAFCVCALASCLWRGGMLYFLVHMLLSVTLLAIVQLGKHNITLDGRLRIPKPFVPYIIITFWIQILGMFYIQSR